MHWYSEDKGRSSTATRSTAPNSSSEPANAGAVNGSAGRAHRACGAIRCASGKVITPRRSNSTSALRLLTSFDLPLASYQPSHSHTRRGKALRVSPPSAADAFDGRCRECLPEQPHEALQYRQSSTVSSVSDKQGRGGGVRVAHGLRSANLVMLADQDLLAQILINLVDPELG
jgi:hypothetical protein